MSKEIRTIVVDDSLLIALKTAYLISCQSGRFVTISGCAICSEDVHPPMSELHGIQKIAEIIGDEASEEIRQEVRASNERRVIRQMNLKVMVCLGAAVFCAFLYLFS